jgi:phosphatidate cytidylyltransferase
LPPSAPPPVTAADSGARLLQILMAMFSYLYYWNFVSKPELSLGQVLAVVFKLDALQQSQLLGKLANMLASQDLLPGAAT